MDIAEFTSPLPKPWLNIKAASYKGDTAAIDQVTVNTISLANESGVPNPPVGYTTFFSDGTNYKTTNPLGVTQTFAMSGSLGDYLPLAGGTMSGDIDMGGNNLKNANSLVINEVVPAIPPVGEIAIYSQFDGIFSLDSLGGVRQYLNGGDPVVTVSPTTAVIGDLPAFSTADGKTITDSGIVAANVVTNPGTGAFGNIARFSSNKVVVDSGVVAANVVTNAGSAVAGNIPSFTANKVIADSGISAPLLSAAIIDFTSTIAPLAPAGQRDQWGNGATGASTGQLAYSSTLNIIWCSHTGHGLDYSIDGGHTFNPCVFDVAPTNFCTVGSNPANLVACVSSAGETYHSTDGINFTKNVSALTSGLYSYNLIWFPAGNVFVYSDGPGGAPCYSWSADAITWNSTASTTLEYPDTFATNGSIVVAVNNEAGVGATVFATYSTDGKTWTPTPTPITACVAVAWSADLQVFVAVTRSGNAYSSVDGIHWTLQTANPTIPVGNYPNLMWVGGSIQRWYYGVTDVSGNYSLWTSTSEYEPFIGTHLDGAASTPNAAGLVYYAPNNNFVIGTLAAPNVQYSTPRPIDIKALSDNIRVRGFPVQVSKFSTSAGVSVNNTTTETDVTNGPALGNLVFQAAQTPGMCIKMNINFVTTTAGDTLTLRFKINDITFATFNPGINPGSNQPDMLKAVFTIQSAAILGYIDELYSGTQLRVDAAYNPNIQNTMTITAQWGSALSQLTVDQIVASVLFINGA